MTLESGWIDEAFFETAERQSVDGGTTSSGDLWHGINTRWGHSMHTMCSYYGMFPAKVAHYFIQRYSEPGDLVVDPFSGRGTTALQARVEGRRAIANDLNPLGYVLSKSKVHPPEWPAITHFIDEMEAGYRQGRAKDLDVPADIRMLYHDNTLEQLVYLRSRLLSKPMAIWSPEELMMAGALAGIMHGSWRRDDSSQYLSISMPNTFSMSPTYVAKYISENGLQKLDQDVFERLRDKVARLYLDDPSGPEGVAQQLDASDLLQTKVPAGSADLVLTSPPYLQVVNYGTSNWIRLWLLGLDEVGRDRGAGRVRLDAQLDHRHTYNSYKAFMLRTLSGIRNSLRPDGIAVVVIGDVANPGKEPVPLAAKLWEDLEDQTDLRLLEIVEDDLPAQNKVSRIWGDTKGQATNRDCALVLTPRNGQPKLDREVSWEEGYKDGGPDAAHERVRSIRSAREPR